MHSWYPFNPDDSRLIKGTIMTKLMNPKYDGNGALWVKTSVHEQGKPCMQGSIQIGGRVIALTIWANGSKSAKAPNYNITVNERVTGFDELLWFKGLSPTQKKQPSPASPPVIDSSEFDDDIPF